MKIKYDTTDYQIIEHRRCANVIKNKSTGFESAGFTSPKSAKQFLDLVLAGHTVVSTTKVGNYYSAQFSNGEEVKALANKNVATNVYLDLTGQRIEAEVKTNEYVVDQNKLEVAKSVDDLIDEVKQLRLWCEKNLSTEFTCLLTNVVIAEGDFCPWVPPVVKPVIEETRLTESLKDQLIKVMFKSPDLSKSTKSLVVQALVALNYSSELVEYLESNGRGKSAIDIYNNYVDEYTLNPPATVDELSIISFNTLLNDYEVQPEVSPELVGQFIGYSLKYFKSELIEWVNQFQ